MLQARHSFLEYSSVVTMRKDYICVYFVNRISLVLHSTRVASFILNATPWGYTYISHTCAPSPSSSLIRLCAKFAEYKKEEVIFCVWFMISLVHSRLCEDAVL